MEAVTVAGWLSEVAVVVAGIWIAVAVPTVLVVVGVRAKVREKRRAVEDKLDWLRNRGVIR